MTTALSRAFLTVNDDNIRQQCNAQVSSPDRGSRSRFRATSVFKMAACRRALAFVERAIRSSDVVLYSRTTCPFCIRAKKVLNDVGIKEMEVFELDQRDDGQELQVQTP